MMKKLFRLVVFLTLLALVLIPAVPVGAIQNGSYDGNNHSYVCLIVFYDEADMPLWRTTGALLSKNVVLTAGHGTAGAAKARVWFTAQIPAGAAWDGVTGARPETYPWGGPDAYEGVPDTHPYFMLGVDDKGNGLPNFDWYDIGVVTLEQSAPTTSYAALPTASRIAALKQKERVDLVGYGMNYQVKGKGVTPADSWQWQRARYYAPADLNLCNDVIAWQYFKISANPSQGKGGATFGDAGGPVLDGGTNVILAINSFVTNANCDGVFYAQRLDPPCILDWIRYKIDEACG